MRREGDDKAPTKERRLITNKKAKVALVHVARNRCRLDEESYRSLLYGAAGVQSASEIEWEDQFRAVLDAFERLGFKSLKAQGKTTSRPVWNDSWACHAAQRAKIEVMWRTVARNKNDQALRTFIKRISHVDSPAFLTPFLAQKVILALEKMMRDTGLDPETGGRART